MRRSGTLAALLSAELSAELSTAALTDWVLLVALAAGVPDPDSAKAIPPPARKPARVMPAPQRRNRFFRSPAGGTGVPAGEGPPAGPAPTGLSYKLFMPCRVGRGSWTSPRPVCTQPESDTRVCCRRAERPWGALMILSDSLAEKPMSLFVIRTRRARLEANGSGGGAGAGGWLRSEERRVGKEC